MPNKEKEEASSYMFTRRDQELPGKGFPSGSWFHFIRMSSSMKIVWVWGLNWKKWNPTLDSMDMLSGRDRNPTPPGGGMFKVDHFQIIRPSGIPAKVNYSQSIRYWE